VLPKKLGPWELGTQGPEGYGEGGPHMKDLIKYLFNWQLW
jgi:hypothetical protein